VQVPLTEGFTEISAGSFYKGLYKIMHGFRWNNSPDLHKIFVIFSQGPLQDLAQLKIFTEGHLHKRISKSALWDDCIYLQIVMKGKIFENQQNLGTAPQGEPSKGVAPAVKMSTPPQQGRSNTHEVDWSGESVARGHVSISPNIACAMKSKNQCFA